MPPPPILCRNHTAILVSFAPFNACFARYERQLAARVTELNQRAGDTISRNLELRRQIDEAGATRPPSNTSTSSVLKQMSCRFGGST
jgi:hypothetical protein